MIVFGQPHRQCGHRSHRARHADDGACLACGNGPECFVDVLVDILDGFVDLRFGRRIVPEMAFGRAYRADVHGEGRLHLRDRLGHTVTAQHQFGGASAQIDHQIWGFDIPTYDARRTKETQIGFFRSGNDFRTDAENTLDGILELFTILGVASGRSSHEANAIDRMFSQYPGELTSGRIGTFQRLIGETVGLVDILPQADYAQNAGHDVFHAVLIHTGDLQTD